MTDGHSSIRPEICKTLKKKKVLKNQYNFSYQHCCPQVKLVEELSNKNMHFEHVRNIFTLHVSEDIDKPLKIPMWRANPQKIDFFAGHSRVPIGRGTKDQIVENGSIGSNTNASANHNGHFKFVPILVATSKRTFDSNLGRVVFIFFLVIDSFIKTEKKENILPEIDFVQWKV